MNTRLARKRKTYVLIGGLLTAGCGMLVGMGLILSWRSPWHDLEYFLKFVLHPATLGMLRVVAAGAGDLYAPDEGMRGASRIGWWVTRLGYGALAFWGAGEWPHSGHRRALARRS